jgi:hypothetical protein
MAKTLTIPAPVSNNVALAMRLSGVVCLGTAAVGVIALMGGLVSGLSGIQCSVIMPIMFGAGLLAMPGRVNEQRAKLLDKRAADLEKGDPTIYVEKPPDPDLVRISLLFGILAIVMVPMLFGPLAVVTGVVALVQGHRKAMIGAVLGVLGLAVWGALFYFLVLH